MNSNSQTKINANYSAYRNYSKRQNKNVLLNKVQIDSGYPQDVFVKNTPIKSHDYIQQNKKNLKNFFKDRLPQQQITKDSFKTKTIVFDPVRIFEIKRQQFQLKNQTKMILNSNYLQRKQKSMQLQNKQIQKISKIFYVNDKTLQTKKKFGSLHIPRFDSYSKDNYRRGTRSFMQKRSRILKRQAYEKVFGPDISSVSRTLQIIPNSDLQSIQTGKQKNKKRKQQTIKLQNKKQDLSNLIKKIQNFKNKIKPVKLNYHQDQQYQNNNYQSLIKEPSIQQQTIRKQKQQNKQKVLELIHNITTMYKGQTIQDNRTKINSIQDIQKLDSKFYQQLNLHKKTRIQKRMYQLYKYSTPQTNSLVNSKLNLYNQQKFNQRIQKNSGRLIRRHPSDILTITDHGDTQSIILDNIQFKRRPTVHQRFRSLGIHLVKAYLLAHFYMVKKQYLYPAFWQQKQPFQLQGSYAFFKAIKISDLECVQSFIKIDLNYLYEVDMNGKTPLIYACVHNKFDIASYFLKLGSNVDKTCKKNKTALYYALQNKNIQIVTQLLRYGADPWSRNNCPYTKMIKSINDERFNIVFSNAKKIYLAVRLQIGTKKRADFWHQSKNKIVYQKRIQF